MELAYRNVADTLAHFGATMSDVVEQRVYVTDIDEASAALEVRKAAYGEMTDMLIRFLWVGVGLI